MYGQHGKPETYKRGKDAELKALKILQLYYRNHKVEATQPGSQEDRSGTDIYVYMDGRKISVDVKAIKKHAPTYILVEHQNVSGNPGWAHKPGIAAIFVSENSLVLVEKKYLSLLLNDARKIDWARQAVQQPRETSQIDSYRPYGRPENNDLVVYIPYQQLMRLMSSVLLEFDPATQTVKEVR